MSSTCTAVILAPRRLQQVNSKLRSVWAEQRDCLKSKCRERLQYCLPELQGTFHLEPGPTGCWHWSSGAVLILCHQRNDANSQGPVNGQSWIPHLELTSTWEKMMQQELGTPFPLVTALWITHAQKKNTLESNKITVLITDFEHKI